MKCQVKEVKIGTALYSIAKNENFSKTAATFLVYDKCLLTVTILRKSCEILIMYIFHESTVQTLLQCSRLSI